jgi:hypothetical protein
MQLKVVTGELVDKSTINSAKELDKRIRECLRDYVQLGKLLMQMRDNQAYRLVGPYDTFEDYCKDVEGLAYRPAQRKIQAYLVHKAIEENMARPIGLPNIEAQVRQFFEHDGAIARFKTERRIIEKRDGTKTSVEVPVAVANPKKVAEQWANTVKAYEAAVERSQKAHQAKLEHAKEMGLPEPAYRRPKLTGTFVVNELPREYQPTRFCSGEAHHFVRWISSVMKGVEAIEKMWETDGERWSRLIDEPHRKKLSSDVVSVMQAGIADAIDVLRKFSKDIKDEFGE